MATFGSLIPIRWGGISLILAALLWSSGCAGSAGGDGSSAQVVEAALKSQLKMAVVDGDERTYSIESAACMGEGERIDDLTFYSCRVLWDVPPAAVSLRHGRTCAAVDDDGRVVQRPPDEC